MVEAWSPLVWGGSDIYGVLSGAGSAAAAVAGVGEDAAKALLQPRPQRKQQAHQPRHRALHSTMQRQSLIPNGFSREFGMSL